MNAIEKPLQYLYEDVSRQFARRKIARNVILLILLAGDTMCITLSYLLAVLLYQQHGPMVLQPTMIVAILVAYLFTAANMDAYSLRAIAQEGRATMRAVQAVLVSFIAVVMAAFALKASEDFSRLVTVGSAILSIIAIGLFRHMAVNRLGLKFGHFRFNTVLLQDDVQIAPSIAQAFCVSIDAKSVFEPAAPTPATYAQLEALLRDADRVIIAASPERRALWSLTLKGSNIRGEVIAPELADLAPLGISDVNGERTLVVSEGSLGPLDAAIKRAFDFSFALTSIILKIPVFLLVAAAIKLDSQGPVIFVQIRVGQGNRLFRMLKFRSMTVAGSDYLGATSTTRTDQRVTRVGRIIRSTSLDELPQLFNVLWGDMSIVGPRPHALESRAENELFWDIDQRYWMRHAVKPGLTGLAQVRGFRGATDQKSDLTDRLQADLEYLRDWSIWRDIRIIMLTFRVLTHHRAF